jgi:DNA polymerase I-like protein with 3'-5' exonuclease and polymerase domains
VKARCTTQSAYQLLHDGSLALAEIEAAGVRIDRGRLEETSKRIDADVADLERKMRSDKVWAVWKKAYGDGAKFDSRDQLADIIFNRLGYESKEMTTKGRRPKANKEALEVIDLDFVIDYLRTASLKKAKSTYLDGIRREMVEHDGLWFIHPGFNLNTTATFRSSSDGPNWQNNPVRNPEMAEAIRRVVVPRPGCDFAEPDFSQVEVRMATVYSGDPVLLADATDPDKDTHRDVAASLFRLDAGQVPKKTLRHVAKNRFVFPQFYGSSYFNCAKNIWQAITHQKMRVGKDGDGDLAVDHLRKKGVTHLGECDPEALRRSGGPAPDSFVAVCKEVQDKYWRERHVHTAWRQRTYERYCRTGRLRMKTGLVSRDNLSRNQVYDYQIQCDAFMGMLWSLTRLLKLIRKYRMKTKIVGEIHDSHQDDIPRRERDDFLNLTIDVMTRQLPKAWPWINVPLAVEVEVSPEGTSWYDKKQWIPDSHGHWSPKP